MNDESRDLTRVVLLVLFIFALLLASVPILAPFLLAIVWASTIAVATWPLLLAVEARLGKRRGVAVAVMLLAFVLPVGLAVDSIVSHRETISGWLAAHERRVRLVMSRAGGLGMVFVQFLLTVAIAGIFYARGEIVARGSILFARRLGGDRG